MLRTNVLNSSFIAAAVIVAGFAFSSVHAQTYIPIAPINPPADKQAGKLMSSDFKSKLLMNDVLMSDVTAPTSAPSLVPAPAALPECSPIPTTAQIAGNLEYHQSYLSTSAAAKLGLPIGGSGSGSATQMVFVRDFSRGIQCQGTDGTTTLFYGQAIRTIIVTSNLEGKADVTLPFLAANASLNNKSNQISVIVYGFANPKIDTVIANIAGKELNVETYGDFIQVEKNIIALIPDSGTTQSVARLGAITTAPPVNLSENVIIAYALAQISNRNSCVEAKNNFHSLENPAAHALDETYKSVIGKCDGNKPSEIQKLQAKELLLGLKVGY